MNDDNWGNLLDQIKQKFEVIDEGKEPEIIQDDLGNEARGTKEKIVFLSEDGRKMMVTRSVRPVILDKKSHYHKTQAGGARIEYVFSEDETTSKINLYVWSNPVGDWQEIDTKGGSLSF